MTLTYNLGSVAFYLNGASAGAGTIATARSTSLFASNGNLLIGKEAGNTNYAAAVFDEVRLSQVVRWTAAFTAPAAAHAAN